MNKNRILAAALAAAVAGSRALPALADLTIGVSISLTGPTSALGIPTQKGIALWPKEIAGEKLNVIVLDDATDPTKGVQNTRKLITEDKVDVVVGSVTTPVAIAMADVCSRGQDAAAHAVAGQPAARQGRLVVPHAAVDRGDGDPDRRAVEEARRQDLRLPRLLRRLRRGLAHDIKPLAEKAGIKLVDTERFARSDTAVTGQALKLMRPTPTRSSSSPRAAARRCRTRAWSSAATRRARSTRPTARRRWT